MAPEKLKYSKVAVQKAGKDLRCANEDKITPERLMECMTILSNWKACYINTLNRVSDTLSKCSKETYKHAVVVSRLKRTPSIINKLSRNPKMNLDRMQDIAGCRSIVSSIKQVNKIKKKLKNEFNLKETDYINSPKNDGYRSLHLIGKSISEIDNKNYNFEIQVRTELQHSWATAVEIVDLFTNQSLKTNQGKPKWKEFFKMVSNEFSKMEDCGYNSNLDSNLQLQKLVKTLDIFKRFEAFRVTLDFIDKDINFKKHAYCLIQLDTQKESGNIHFFHEDQFVVASRMYLELEQQATRQPNQVIALVNVASIDNLKEAFPNYFADSTHFIHKVREILSTQPNKVAILFSKWLNQAGL